MDKLTSVFNKVKNTVDQYRGTELERRVKELTSPDINGVSSTAKMEIARATFDYQAYREVMPLIWNRMLEPGQQWTVVFKCVNLLEFLVRNGSPSVIDEVRGRQYELSKLKDYTYDDGERDHGTGVRDTAKRIIELINDEEMLKQVRRDAKANRDKFIALSNSTGSSYAGFGSGGGSSAGSGTYGGYGNNSSFGGGSSGFGGGYRDDDDDAKTEQLSTYTKSKPTTTSTTTSSSSTTSSTSSSSSTTTPATTTGTKKVVKKVVKKPAASTTTTTSTSTSGSASTEDPFDVDFADIAAESYTSATSSSANKDDDVDFADISVSAPVPSAQVQRPTPSVAVTTNAPSTSASLTSLDIFGSSTSSAPSAPSNYDIFATISAPMPAPSPQQGFDFTSPSSTASVPSTSGSKGGIDDVFGDFSSATTSSSSSSSSSNKGSAFSGEAVEAKIKAQYGDLVDLDDLTGSKPKQQQQSNVSAFRPGYNAQGGSTTVASNDPFAGLGGFGSSPAPAPTQAATNPMMMMGGKGMGMGIGMGMNMGVGMNMGMNMGGMNPAMMGMNQGMGAMNMGMNMNMGMGMQMGGQMPGMMNMGMQYPGMNTNPAMFNNNNNQF